MCANLLVQGAKDDVACGTPGLKPGGGNRWTEDEDEDDDNGREDGELAADAQAPSAKRQRHEPIVWAARGGKQPGTASGSSAAAGGSSQREQHLDKVESTTRLTGLDSSGAASPAGQAAGPQGPPPRPRSAAEIIAAEAEEFRRRAALDDDIDPAAPPAMRASPSGSDDGGEGVPGGTDPNVKEPVHIQLYFGRDRLHHVVYCVLGHRCRALMSNGPRLPSAWE